MRQCCEKEREGVRQVTREGGKEREVPKKEPFRTAKNPEKKRKGGP